MDASVVVALAMSFVALLVSLALLGVMLRNHICGKKQAAKAYELYMAGEAAKIDAYKRSLEEANPGQAPATSSAVEGGTAQFTQALSEALYQPPSLSHASAQSPPR